MSINPIYKIVLNKIMGTYYVYRTGHPVTLRKGTTLSMRKFFAIASITYNTPAFQMWEYRG